MKNGLKIVHIFDGANKRLIIPVYQRKYAWSRPQCERLFNDIESMIETGQPSHFFGSIVGKAEGSFEWQVIDGQQRLTTTSLLMLALVHSIEDREIECSDPNLSSSIKESYLLARQGGELVLKLKPIEDDASAYEAVFNRYQVLPEESNIVRNYRYFREALASTNLSAEDIWNRGIWNLQVMHLDLEDHDHPQRIFETLNSTGVALAESDKIRNFVLMDHPTAIQNKLYKDYWLQIEKQVGDHSDWFFRQYLAAKRGTWARRDRVYPEFQLYVSKSALTVEEILSDVLEFAILHRNISDCSTEFPSVNRQLRRANLILGDVTLPFLWNVYRDARSGIIDERDLLQVIKIVETHSFRRTTSAVASNALNKIYATMYGEVRKVFTEGETYSNIVAFLLLRRANTSGRIPNDEEFREAFLTRNFFNTPVNFKRYLFDHLENGDSLDTHDIIKGLETDSLSVEHIMPQTLTPAWKKMLGDDFESIHSAWIHRIGNLTVTGYNSSYSNLSFPEKKDNENGFVSTSYRLNEYVKRQETWAEEQMAERTKQLTDFAVEHWPLPTTTFTPPPALQDREPLGEDTRFVNRTITGYEFNGTQLSVENWSQMLVSFLSVLDEDHHDALNTFAETNGLVFNKQEPWMEGNGKAREFANDMWVFVNTDTTMKVELLRKIFAALGLDPYELIFILKPLKEQPEAEPEKENKYSELTKFIPRVAELAETNEAGDSMNAFVEEFSKSFEPFRVENARKVLHGRTPIEFLSSASIEEATAEETFALLSQILGAVEYLGISPVKDFIDDGNLQRVLRRLVMLGSQ
ncbi:DUF262 domain-containing protein [Corynebacterium minutissimum]|nr:DUF262 domain-containing protein [Corynebacterium minutissimum]KHO30178.1 hypothetical protein NX84_04205 [Corynebacterium minutissimum]QPS60529.1 DUF262 domain-containing protein [Corynebacterium minutissimum]QQA78683.1 DUF262 domain-containing protein [Corynebacterium minutissimum]